MIKFRLSFYSAWLSSFVTLFLACNSESTPPPEGDASVPYMNRCGDGQNTLNIGIGEPFEAATMQTGDDGVERALFSVNEGHQGGYHIDVSIRIVGRIDPDLVDVRMKLDLADGLEPLAIHSVDEWYLKLTDDRAHCEYPLARLVFAETSGQLMPLEAVTALLNKNMYLSIEIDASDGTVRDTFELVLTEVIRLE